MTKINWKSAGITFLVAVGIASIAAIGGYVTAREYFADKLRDDSAYQINERVARQNVLFDDVRAISYAAERSFLRRYNAIADADVSEEFNRLFPPYGDGTRRSDPALYDGLTLENGDYVYGLGAFISDVDVPVERQRRLLAAFHTVRQHGEAINPRFDNLNFVTQFNDLIIFAPQRDDHLEYYRMQAPADFDFQSEQLAQIVEPQNNPTGQTACTSLSRLMYVADGSALTTGCHTPVRHGGHHVGAFGITISMQNYLANAIVDAEPNSENMILSREGDLIAHRDLLFLDVLTADAVSAANQEARAGHLAEIIRHDGRSTGVVTSDDGRIVAYARIETPGWYFVTTRPVWLIHSRASQIAGMIFVFSFLGVFLQHIVVGLYRWQRRWRIDQGRKAGHFARA
ncbi:hypothetical protein V0U79_01830 [Hyphobacterium sp. HN65]|uniref:Cache domain-containing protein n=1 Tax=Hyphobacterium lacteum TaxID=3116575 RepID=A0ABU7LMJ0_9PROT|nr:hypothetical protein [Hyphobacterium sp. HN65]MEE2525088.1 hypothetical protein [Hyphobacterium sp. HN65]